MTSNEVAIAVKEWCEFTLNALGLATGYHYLSAEKGSLPDVMVDIAEKTRVPTHPAFPYAQLEQVDLRVFEVTAAFMVEKSAVPDHQADQDETEQLRAFSDELEAALVGDATLGDRVPMASPFATFDFRLPFVQYPDGTRGRQMTLTLFVAEPVQSSN